MTTLPEYPPITSSYKKDNRIIIVSTDLNKEVINLVVSHVVEKRDDPKEAPKTEIPNDEMETAETTANSPGMIDHTQKEDENHTELMHISDEICETSITSKCVDTTQYVMTSTKLRFPADDAEAIADYFMEVARMISEKFVWPKKLAARTGPKIPYVH